MASPQSSRILMPRYGVPLCRSGSVIRPAAWPAFQGLSQGRTPCSSSAITRSVTRVERSARGVAVEVFIVGLLSLGSLRERSEPFPPLVHPSGETATRESCEAALAFMAEQGEWSGPPLNARRGGLRRAATVTLRKEQMKT